MSKIWMKKYGVHNFFAFSDLKKKNLLCKLSELNKKSVKIKKYLKSKTGKNIDRVQIVLKHFSPNFICEQ